MLASAAASRNGGQQQKASDATASTPSQQLFESPQSRTGRTPSISPLSTVSKSQNDSAVASALIPDALADAARTLMGEGHGLGANNSNSNRRDRSSSLSDIAASLSEDGLEGTDSEAESVGATVEEEDDSEAETERIKPTPQKLGHLSNVILGGDLALITEDGQSDTESMLNGLEERVARRSITMAGRKRKRGLAEPTDKGQALDETDMEAGVPKKRGLWQSAPSIEDDAVADGDEKLAEEDEGLAVSIPASPTKEQMRKGAAGLKAGVKRQGEERTKDEGEEMEEHDEGDEEGPEELDADEVSRRDMALALTSGMSGRFGNLKSKMNTDRLAEAEAELLQLREAYPMHDDYIRQLQAVTIRRDTKIAQENKLLFYKKQTLRTSTLATRAQLMSQYKQDARDVRERAMFELGQQWHEVQRGRRNMQADELDTGVEDRFPSRRSTQIRQQAQYNSEVSILSGMAKWIGFPAAPDIEGVKENQVESDFQAMKIQRVPRAQSPRLTALNGATERRQVEEAPPSLARPGPGTGAVQAHTPAHVAHDDFVKHTPWANPHHPVHSRTPSAFGHRDTSQPATQAAGAGPYVGHPPSAQPPPTAGSTFATPQIALDRQRSRDDGGDLRPPDSNETIGMLSDPPSSVLAAPPTTDRLHRLGGFDGPGEASPLAHLKRANHAAAEHAGGGRRDFSGLSGTSTIDAPL